MSDLYENIGQRIKELRGKYGGKGLSQEDLAKEMKTTANTISRWESATYKPSAMDLHKLAKFFGVNISVFFPAMETTRLAALMSALGELGQKDIDELTEYAQFRKARQALKSAKKKK
ncbi:MAG TPA: helix-turn-helix transcriptional regulator [Pyrinomonadaceae bacterium]|jgi:transcriptional regulator with XRE-family HTH domain|nr:helix-turn-helix transcriptional regulator [Pyrinomonadaceae bacterium]